MQDGGELYLELAMQEQELVAALPHPSALVPGHILIT
jgi:hypothetical protein